MTTSAASASTGLDTLLEKAEVVVAASALGQTGRRGPRLDETPSRTCQKGVAMGIQEEVSGWARMGVQGAVQGEVRGH